MPELVLLRHGQSLWNKEGRFTGWEDVDLSVDFYQADIELPPVNEFFNQSGLMIPIEDIPDLPP